MGVVVVDDDDVMDCDVNRNDVKRTEEEAEDADDADVTAAVVEPF